MLAFDMKGGLAAARRFCDRTRIFSSAASPGRSRVSRRYSPCTRHTSEWVQWSWLRRGYNLAPVRVSVGLEDPADLLADLRQALA